jgi:hypothetical protein
VVLGLGRARHASASLVRHLRHRVFRDAQRGGRAERLADRSFDRHDGTVRPLASGELSATHALLVVGLFLSLAGMLVLLLDPLTILLSPIAILLACLYPFAKRVIHVPQAMLGIAFGWGTIMAWTASRGAIEAPAWCVRCDGLVGHRMIRSTLQDRRTIVESA